MVRGWSYIKSIYSFGTVSSSRNPFRKKVWWRVYKFIHLNKFILFGRYSILYSRTPLITASLYSRKFIDFFKVSSLDCIFSITNSTIPLNNRNLTGLTGTGRLLTNPGFDTTAAILLSFITTLQLLIYLFRC